MRRLFLCTIIIIGFSCNSFAQQTVGLFQYDPGTFLGYTLFAPSRSTTTYLIDNCGDLQFTWQSAFTPGNSVEIQADGSLIRSCNFANGSPITGGGAGGRIESILPDQQIDWFFEYSNDSVRLHHDFEVLPSGNVLMIAWEVQITQDAIDQGRDPLLVGGSGLWPEQIIEYNPSTDQIVWSWHSWDHLIQDFDNTKPNFGVVADHPELFDLNFDKGNAAADWQHFNSVAYNEDLDQIALSSPAWNEVYIIDHSTTTAEAASHAGGDSGQGGDILWRWGNPEMYGAGDSTDQQLFFQHDAHWIPSGYRHENKLILFNNGRNRIPVEYSTVNIIAPSILPNGDYEMGGSGTFLPVTSDYIYTAPVPTDFYSRIISSADMLPNGNIIIDEGTQGHYFEIDSLDNIVWDYVNPVVADSILEQEEIIPGTQTLHNSTFRARKIAHDYSGVTSIPLVNQGPVELNPYPSACVVNIGIKEIEDEQVFVYPSPANETVYFSKVFANADYSVMNSNGQAILSGKMSDGSIDVSKLSAGMYFITLQGHSEIFFQVMSFSKN